MLVKMLAHSSCFFLYSEMTLTFCNPSVFNSAEYTIAAAADVDDDDDDENNICCLRSNNHSTEWTTIESKSDCG